MEKEEATHQKAQSTSAPPAVPGLVLETLASYLDPQDLLNMLTVFPKLATQRFPIKSIKIAPALDSIRLCMVTIPNLVEEITCIGVAGASEELKNTMGHIWTSLLSSTSLKKLVTDNIRVLLPGVHLSSSLTTLRIEENFMASPPMREINMDGIRFPASVTEFSVDVDIHHIRPNDFRPTGGTCFFDISHHLPSLTSITLRPCPSRDFWTHVDPSFLHKITHLSIRLEPDSFFPLSLTPNLQTLVYSGTMADLLNMMENQTFSSLKALEYHNYWMSDRTPLSQILLSAPELKILSLHHSSFVHRGRFNTQEAHFMQNLDYFRVRYFNLNEEKIPFLRCLIPRLKCFDLFCDLMVKIDENVRHIDDPAFTLLETAVGEHGGHVEIVHLENNPRRTPFGVLTSRCHVRVLRDQTFNFESILRDHPLLFASKF